MAAINDPFKSTEPEGGIVDPFRVAPVRPTATPSAEPPRLKRTWGEVGKDTLLGVAQGAVNLVGGTAALVESSLGHNQALRTLGEFGVGPGTTSAAADATASANEWIGERLSPTLKRKKQELADTQGFWASAKKVVTDPALAGQFTAEQVPIVATLGYGTAARAASAAGAARPAALGARQAVLTRGGTTADANAAGAKVLEEARQAAGRRFLTGAGATLSSGNAFVQTREEALAQPEEVWDANPAFQRLVSGGMDRQQAKEMIAEKAGFASVPLAAATGALGARVSAPFETSVFTRSMPVGGVRGLLSPRGAVRVAGGIGAEATEETIQEGGEQFSSNLGQRVVDPNQALMEGVAEAAGTGAGIGGLIGGGMAAGGVVATPSAQQPRLRRGGPQEAVSAPEAAPPQPVAPEAAQAPVEAAQPDAAPVPQGEPAQAEEDMFAAQLPPEGSGPPQSQTSAVPFPDAPPGSLQAVVNTITPEAQTEVAAADAAALVEKEGQKGSRPREKVQAGQTVQVDRAGPPVPPWVNRETGEITPPTDADISREVERQTELQSQAGTGLRMDVKATASAWGIDAPRLARIRRDVLDRRKTVNEAIRINAERRQREESAAAGAPATTPESMGNERGMGAGESSTAVAGLGAAGGDVARAGAEPSAAADVAGPADIGPAEAGAAGEVASAPGPDSIATGPRAAQIMEAFEADPGQAIKQLSDEEVLALAKASGKRFSKTAKVENIRKRLATGAEPDVQAALRAPMQQVLAASAPAPVDPVQPAATGSELAPARPPLSVRMGRQEVEVESFEDASRKFRELRDTIDIGGMEVVELIDQAGDPVGWIGPQGEVYAGNFQVERLKRGEREPIYVPPTMRRGKRRDVLEGQATTQAEEVGDGRNVGAGRIEAAAPAGLGDAAGGQALARSASRESEANAGEPVAAVPEGVAPAGGAAEPAQALTEERRANEAERARIDALPADARDAEIARLRGRVAELERETRTSQLTGLPNKAAFEADAALGWPSVVAIDMDGLKRLNDSIGHENADAVLRALARELDALASDSARFYHRSGDEFAARFKSPTAAAEVMANLQQDLEGLTALLTVQVAGQPDQAYEYKGIGISYGLGADYEQADLAANAQKRERAAAGLREDPRADGPSRRLREVPRDPEGREGDPDGAAAGPPQVAPAAPAQTDPEAPAPAGASVSGDPVEAAAAEAATSPANDLPAPTEAQKEAGNYKKGHVRLHGLDIAIENPAGTRRRPEWPPLAHHYGYIKRTEGADGDHVDVFLGDNAADASLPVFVVDQVNRQGEFDEHKVVMGFPDEAAARDAYLANYSKGWKGLGSIRGMSLDEFKAWLAKGDTTKPAEVVPTVRSKQGKPTYILDAKTLGAYFQPGRIVKAYIGYDRVLGFNWNDGNWSVRVIGVNKDGSPKAGEDARVHRTAPSLKELVEVFGDPAQYAKPRRAPAQKEAAPAQAEAAPAVTQDAPARAVTIADFNGALNTAKGELQRALDAMKGPAFREQAKKFLAPWGIKADGKRADVTKQVLDTLDTGNPSALREFGVRVAPSITAALEAKFEGRLVEKAPVAPERARTPPAPTQKAAAGNTEDSGAELWFNRRNRGGEGLQWSDIEGLNATLKMKEAVKSKVWPRPDYEALVADGMHPVLARLLKQVYDGIAAKPAVRGAATDAQLREYVEVVGQVRDAVFDALRKVGSAGDALATMAGEGPALGETLNVAGLSDLEARIFPSQTRNRYGAANPDNNRRALLVGGNRAIKSLRIGIYDVRNAAKEVEAGWPTPREAWERMFTIREAPAGTKVYRNGEQVTLTAPEFFIVKTGQRRIAAEGLPTREAAVEKARELATKNRKKGETLAEEAVDLLEAVRTGAARRAADEDVTSDRLRETFGFKGVNFGNWMKGDSPAKRRERQLHLNHAYDAFADLAELMNVPAKALSLNGMLGLAFGAQGSGRGSGAAHFVPGMNEINLTRAAGVGSLAHEWGHALDHYFAVQAGDRFAKQEMPFITHAIAEGLTSETNLRPEVLESFRAVYQAMTRRPLTAEEVAERTEKRRADELRRLNTWLKPLRAELERRAKPAEKDRALAEFDALSDRIRAGDLGEGYVPAQNARGGLRPVLADMRNLIKDATGRVPSKQDFDGMAVNAEAHAYSVANREDAKSHVPQVAASNYAIEAAKLDKDPRAFGGGNYWKLPTEMLARAFQSYVLDRLADRQARNDYLTRPQMDEATLKAAQDMGLAESGDRYPRGAEREAINSAFDALVQTLRTRQDEAGNVALFSQPAEPASASPDVSRVRAIVAPITAGWADTAPRVEVVADAEGLPARAKADPGYKTAEGFYDDSTGTVYLVARRLPNERAVARVLVHEGIGHFGVEAITGPALWEQLGNTVARMRESGKHAALFTEIDQRYRGANASIALRETLAVMAEKGVRNSVMDRAIAAVRQFIRNVLGLSIKFSEAELRQHLVAAARYVRAGARPRDAAAAGATPAPAFSKGTRSAFKDATTFATTARNFLDGKLPGTQPLQVTEGTPDVFTKLGAPDVPILIRRDTINKLALASKDGKHPEVTRSLFMGLVRHLHEPVAVFTSATEQGGLVALTEVEVDGKPIMVSVHVRDSHDRMVVNRVTSIYGRERREDFVRWAREGRLRYLDRTRVPAWLTTAGLQLPGVGPATTGTARRVLVETDVIKPFTSGAGAYSRSSDPFYSALTAAVSRAAGAPRRGDAAAWKGWLDGAQRRGEFRQSERDWLGVDAWLEGRSSTTREELADFVRANAVQVSDVVLDERGTELPQGWSVDPPIDEDGNPLDYGDWVVVDEAGNERGMGPTREQAIADSQDEDYRGPSMPKFSAYQLPGGENYRELLLTLPRAETAGQPIVDNGTLEQFALRPGQPTVVRAPEFRSSHFDQPNILAHVRFNERTDADGKRVLFIEEIQSDWHQAGRKRGYRDGSIGKEWADAGYGVPDAPFKGTDEWAMLAFKRMARWAVDNGFDRIAWTTGEQQAERYDLSKQVSKIYWKPNDTRPGRTGPLSVFPKEGPAVQLPKGAYAEAELADVIGKEAADRLLASPKNQAGVHILEGESLKVGGEGMRAFYDKILPSAVNKWAKRFGAKPTTAGIALHVKPTTYFISEPAEGGAVLWEGFGPATREVARFDTRAEADARLRELAGGMELAQVHAVDITPAMQDAVLAGQPLFSQPPAQALADLEAVMTAGQDARAVDRIRQRIKDMTPAKVKDALRGTWLGALATNHLTELGSDYFQGMRHYTDFLKQMEADRNTLMGEGEEIAERVRKWAAKNKPMARRLFDLMHEATIDGVDPAKEYQVLQFRFAGKLHDATPKNVAEAIKAIRQQMRERSGDPKQDMLNRIKALTAMAKAEKRRRGQYGGLVAKWNELSPEAQQAYKDMRDTYARRSDAIEEALVQRIEDLKADGVTDSQRRVMVTKIREQFETNRLQGVYFPLQRFGRYFVAAEKDDTSTFLMYESLNEASRAEKDLKARGWKITSRGKRIEAKAENAPSGTFVAEVIGELRKANISEKTQDSIYQLYLNALPELSMRKHQIHRKAVPGFDPDAVRAFGWHMQHGSHQLAKLRHMHKLEGVLKLLEKQQKDARSEPDADIRRIAAGDAVLEELNKRHEWIANPVDSKLTNLASSFGFAYYLGVTPAAALVNLSQTAIVTYPVLAARFGGAKAMNALLSASKDAARTIGNIDRTLTDPEEQRAYAALKASGAIDKTQAHNLAGIAEGGLTGYNPAWAKTMEVIGWAFHKAEVVNREASSMAAYRLAREAGMDFDAAVRFAHDAVIETHFDYSNANRARFMQSGTAKVLLMFRQYSLNVTWFLARNVWQATKGLDAETRTMARRKLAGVLGMTSLFSGVLGLPLVSVTFGVLNAVADTFGDDDEPWDAETEFRNFLADMLGPQAANLVATGAANSLTGADIASRVSLSQLWFRDADRELEGRGMYYHLLEQAAGPMGGVLKNVLVGKQQFDEGHVWRGVETMLPKALKDGMKGIRYATEGVNNLRGDPLVQELSLWQTLLQAQGFTPAQVARQYDANGALKGYEQFILSRRQRLVDAYALAWRLGDQQAMQDALGKMQTFSRANPELAINAETIRRSLKTRLRYSQRAEDGIVLNPKLEARLRGAVRFNGEGGG